MGGCDRIMVDEWRCPDTLAELADDTRVRAARALLVGVWAGLVLQWLASVLSMRRWL